MSSAASPIGIFDSGLGGLSVVESIRRQLANEALIYVADSAHCPYGEKPVEFLRQRATAIVNFLLQEGCKAIVVACNTATIATAAILRQQFDIPVVGLEPAVKPAVAATRSGVIGVLATTVTLQSEQYEQLVDRHAEAVRVLSASCPGWVEVVEQGLIDGAETRAMVESRVRPLLDEGADMLVLGCTHFPFLRPVLDAIVGPHVAIIDTGEAVARQLQRRLEEHGLLAMGMPTPMQRFLTSGDPASMEAFVRRVWPEIARIERFDA